MNGGNVLHRGGDVYEEMVVMCALETKDLTGSFTLEVISNLPFRLEPMELSTVSAPLRELKNAKNKQKGLGGTPCSPQRVRVTAQDFNARLDEIAANGKEVQVSLRAEVIAIELWGYYSIMVYWCTGGILFHVEWCIRLLALIFFYHIP